MFTPKQSKNVDLDPNNANVNALNSAKENLELFYEEKVHGIVIRARARSGMNMVKEVANISLIWRKGIM